MEDGGFCGGAARCGCGVFLRLPPPATTETTLGNSLLAPSFRRPPRPPPRVSTTPPPPPPASTVPGSGGGLVFPSGGEKSPCFSLHPFSLFVPSPPRAQPLAGPTFPTILPSMTTRGLHEPRAVFRTPSSLRRTTGDSRDVQGEMNFRR